MAGSASGEPQTLAGAPRRPGGRTADPARRRTTLKWGLRLLGPLMLVVVVARLPDPAAVATLIGRASPGLLLLVLCANLPAVHLKVLRWQGLLRARAISYPTADAWLAFGSSIYLGTLTPGRVGDALRAQYLRHDLGVRYAEGLASVVVDRLCDLYVLAAFVALATVRYGGALGGRAEALAWSAVAATALGPLVLLLPRVPERLFSLAYRRIARDSGGDGLDCFLAAVRALTGRPLLLALPLTVACFLIAFGQGWLLARALGLHLPYLEALCLISVASLMGLLPISVSGVGVREAFYAAVFPALGLAASDGVGFGLLVFAVIYVGTAAVGAVAWHLRPPPLAT